MKRLALVAAVLVLAACSKKDESATADTVRTRNGSRTCGDGHHDEDGFDGDDDHDADRLQHDHDQDHQEDHHEEEVSFSR